MTPGSDRLPGAPFHGDAHEFREDDGACGVLGVAEHVEAARLDALGLQRVDVLFVEAQPASLILVPRVGHHRVDGSLRHLFAKVGIS